MIITSKDECNKFEVSKETRETDLLNSEKINRMGYLIGETRDGWRYDIESVSVESGFVRFLVCGLVQLGEISDFSFLIGENGEKVEVDSLYND